MHIEELKSKPWGALSTTEVNRIRNSFCKKCTHFFAGGGDKLCNYPWDMEAETGIFTLRHCSPFECKEQGKFAPRKGRKRRGKLRLPEPCWNDFGRKS